jgi:hypothetical protein
MTEVRDQEEAALDSLPSGPILLDGKPTRAPAILTLSDDGAALWLIDLTGEPCGAWTSTPLDDDGARRFLAVLEGRALVSIEQKRLLSALEAVTERVRARVSREVIEQRLCSISELLADLAAVRTESTEVSAPAMEERPPRGTRSESVRVALPRRHRRGGQAVGRRGVGYRTRRSLGNRPVDRD